MRISRLLLLAAVLPGGEAGVIELRCLGQTVLDSGATRPVEGSAKGLLVERLGADGRRVGPGDCLIVFDPSQIAAQLDDRRRGAAIVALEYARWRSNRDAELAGLESERRRLRAELAAVRAAIAVQAHADPQRIALLDAQRRQAELDASLAERDARRQADEHARGQISGAGLAAAESAAGLARLGVAGPTLAWQLAVAPNREPEELALLRVQELSLAARLGLDPTGQESSSLGIGARLTAAQAQLVADAAARRADLDRAEAELRQYERESSDHTPLAWIEIRPEGGETPLQRVRFAPADQPEEPGWTIDHGEAFAATSGHGWDRALIASELPWRAAPATAAAATPVTKAAGAATRRADKRGGAKKGPAWVGGVALPTGQSTWSMLLPNGRYQVKVGLGDNREWDGPALRAEGVAFALPPRLPTGILESTLTVAVDDGRLDVQVGDGLVKAVRAEAAGIVVHQPGIKPGFRVEDPSRPLAHLVATDSFVVDTQVAQELAPLLVPGRKADTGAKAELLDRVALAGVELVRRDGSRLPAEVVAVGAQSVRWTRGPRSWGEINPDDALAREVRLRPAAGMRGLLALGENVEVVVRLAPPVGTTILPPHLVHIDRDGALVRVDGQQRPVRAQHVGAHMLVDAELDAASCQEPGERDGLAAEIAAGRFRGGVVPGLRTRLSISWVWGRVESLVADGSRVEAGQVVLSVYNPQMEKDQERTDRERRAAIRNVVAAAERRRQAQLAARGEHASRIAAETEARVRLRHHLDDDPLGAERTGTALRIAAARADDAAAALHRLRLLSTPRPDDLAEAQASVARTAIASDRARLEAARQEVSADWAHGQELAATWAERVHELARREAEIAEAAQQERINTLADRIAMERAVEGDWWQRNFAQRRQVKAPVAGRILFLTGWNDQTQRSEKIGSEFPVWSGMSVAEIVDESRLGFTAELPDDTFPHLAKGQACTLELADAPGRTIPATLSDIGRSFTIPRDRLAGASEQADAVTNRRVFVVTAAFIPPADLRGRITTGAKGWLRIP